MPIDAQEIKANECNESAWEINVPNPQKRISKQNRNESLKNHRKKEMGAKPHFAALKEKISGCWSEKKIGNGKGDSKKELRKTKRTGRNE